MPKRLICGAMAAMTIPVPAAAAEADETPICTDRPTKANAVCTVPVGKWQLESSALTWSRTKAGGVETRVTTAGASVVKYGVSERSDLQVGMAPFVRIARGRSIPGAFHLCTRRLHG